MNQNQRMLTLIELLRRGRERILHAWTQHAPARTARVTTCGASAPAAIAWSATGAAWYTDDSIPDCGSDPCYRLYPEAVAKLRRSLAEVFPDDDHGGHIGSGNH